MLLALGCGSDPRPATPPEPARTEEPAETPRAPQRTEEAPGLADELAVLDGPPRADEVMAMPTPLPDTAAPPRACVALGEPVRLSQEGGRPAIVAAGDAFVAATYLRGAVQVVRVVPGAAASLVANVPIAELRLDRRGAPPALVRTSERELVLGVVEASGRVAYGRFDAASPTPAITLHTVAEGGGDLRFAPAIVRVGDHLAIAWTDGGETPMRLRMVVADATDEIVTRHDLTPVAGGGAAPVVVQGAAAPTLFFVDPRAGISVVHRVTLGAEAVPSPTEVARPLNLASEPPAIAAARASGVDHTWLAYAAVGNGGTRAVGVLDAFGSERPAAIVAGLGYGSALSLDALPGARAVIFASEAPSAADPAAPHEIRVRVVDGSGVGEALVVPDATAPRIARLASGVIGLAYAGSWARFLRCAE